MTNTKQAPTWLVRIGEVSPDARIELSRRGGRKSIQKLLIHNDIVREVKKEYKSRLATSVFEKLSEANEHLVPVDETCNYFLNEYEPQV